MDAIVLIIMTEQRMYRIHFILNNKLNHNMAYPVKRSLTPAFAVVVFFITDVPWHRNRDKIP